MGMIYKNGIAYGGGGGGEAIDVEFDNSGTWLESDNVNDAITEVAGTKLTKAEYDALPEETKNSGVFIITDEDSDPALEKINEINKNLTANGNSFVFDYHDGKYGYNTDINRGADTFVPFSSITELSDVGILIDSDSWDTSISYDFSKYTKFIIKYYYPNTSTYPTEVHTALVEKDVTTELVMTFKGETRTKANLIISDNKAELVGTYRSGTSSCGQVDILYAC